ADSVLIWAGLLAYGAHTSSHPWGPSDLRSGTIRVRPAHPSAVPPRLTTTTRRPLVDQAVTGPPVRFYWAGPPRARCSSERSPVMAGSVRIRRAAGRFPILPLCGVVRVCPGGVVSGFVALLAPGTSTAADEIDQQQEQSQGPDGDTRPRPPDGAGGDCGHEEREAEDRQAECGDEHR